MAFSGRSNCLDERALADSCLRPRGEPESRLSRTRGVKTERYWHSQRGRRSGKSGDLAMTSTVPPVASGQPIREWAFSELRGDSLEEVEVDAGIEVGGLLHKLRDFGPTSRDSAVFLPDGSSLPPDGIATGQITSTADGVTAACSCSCASHARLRSTCPRSPLARLLRCRQASLPRPTTASGDRPESSVRPPRRSCAIRKASTARPSASVGSSRSTCPGWSRRPTFLLRPPLARRTRRTMRAHCSSAPTATASLSRIQRHLS
jgi:hypothetical protein